MIFLDRRIGHTNRNPSDLEESVFEFRNDYEDIVKLSDFDQRGDPNHGLKKKKL